MGKKPVLICGDIPAADIARMLKAIIVVLLVAIILSLGSGAVFFFKDQGEGKRTLYALGVRITLAVLLIICLVYGVLTGQLTLNAPWHN